uniref:Cholecystokinin n=1 Tax=Globodera pallida TaxID=36090 RepID=A0A183BQ22_GLOPA
MSSATISPLLLLPVLLVLLSVFGCHATPPSQHSQTEENVLLEELVREVRKLSNRMDSALGRGGAAEEEELIVEGKRSPQGMAPSVLWNGAGDKRAQLPFSGGIYGKRSPLPFSGGIYGKRSSSHQLYRSPLIFPTLDRQTRAMPFNGGMYGR